MKICAGGFLIKENKFLFGKRSEKKTWAPNNWDIVGGHAMKGENVYDTLKRESQEEIGIVVQSAALLTIFDVPDESNAGFFKYYVYNITSWEGVPVNCSDEHTDIRWFTREELQEISLALPVYLKLIDQHGL